MIAFDFLLRKESGALEVDGPEHAPAAPENGEMPGVAPAAPEFGEMPEVAPAAPENGEMPEVAHVVDDVARQQMRAVRAQLGSNVRSHRKVKHRAELLEQSCKLDLGNRCAQTVFGNSDQVANHTDATVLSDLGPIFMPKAKASQDQYSVELDRGVVSHVHAQAAGLADFVALGGEASIDGTIGCIVFDDASMWVQKPSDLVCAGPNKELLEKLFQKKKLRRGANLSMSVFNKVEYLHCVESKSMPTECRPPSASVIPRPPEPRLRSANVFAPAQVLPQANTATIRSFLNKWAATSPSGVGRNIDPGGELAAAFDNVPWKTAIYIHDNLVVNHCLVGLEAKSLRSDLDDHRIGSAADTLLSVDCAGHSVVLTIKPIYRRISNFNSTLVRLGHILETGRCAQSFNRLLDSEVEAWFEFREVREWPDQFDQWNAHARSVLRRSRPCQDLTPEQEESILAADNGDWNSWSVWHFCKGEDCPLKCNGSRQKSLEGVKIAVKLSVGDGYKLALEYRWKNMEAVACKSYRARSQHRLLDRVLERLHPTSAVEKAKIEAAAILGRAEDIPAAAKRHIKGGKVLSEFRKDPENKTFEAAAIVAQPAQHFLNHIFASEKANCQATQASLATSSRSNVYGWTEKQIKAMKCNAEVFSGRKGRDVVAAYTRMVQDFDDAGWDSCSLTPTEKQAFCPGLLDTMCDAEQRLVHYYRQPKFQIFASCNAGEFSSTLVNRVCNPIAQKAEACPKCVDAAFSKPWAVRLLNANSPRRLRAHRMLCGMLIAIDNNTTKCERLHLLGQETRFHRRRGRCLTAAKLGKVTYAKHVRKESFALRQEVLRKHLPRTQLRRSFGQMVTSFRAKSRRVNNNNDKVAQMLPAPSSKSKHKIRGYDMYLRDKKGFVRQVAGANRLVTDSQQHGIKRKWRDLTPQEKAVYSGMAVAENDEHQKRACENDFADFIAHRPSGSRRRCSVMTEQMHAISNTLGRLQNDDAWESGSAVGDFNAGLRACLVDRRPQKVMKQLASDFFAFDPVGKANPGGKMCIDPVCAIVTGGICQEDPTWDSIRLIMTSLYRQMHARKIKCPVVGQVILGEVTEEHFISKIYGKGEQVWTVKCRRLHDNSTDPLAAGITLAVDNSLSTQPLHASIVLRKVALKGPGELHHNMSLLRVKCYSLESERAEDTSHGGYASRIRQYEFCATPSEMSIAAALPSRPGSKGTAFGSHAIVIEIIVYITQSADSN